MAFGEHELQLTVAGPAGRRATVRAALAAASERAGVHGGRLRTLTTDRRCTTVVTLPLIAGVPVTRAGRGATRWARHHADASMAIVLTIGALALGVPLWRDSALVVADSLGVVAVCALAGWRRRYPIAVAVAAGILLFVPYLNSGGTIVGDGAVSVPAGAASFLIALALGTERPWARSLFGLVPLTAGWAIPAGQFNPFLLMLTIRAVAGRTDGGLPAAGRRPTRPPRPGTRRGTRGARGGVGAL